MQTFIRLMHSMPARLAWIFGGLWLVIRAADLPPGSAFLLAAAGTAIAVTGIADISMTELVVNAMRARAARAEERAA
jgi:hypothetical protein